MQPTVTVRNDTLTVAAIAVAAMCLVTFDHEALGHGGVCLGVGGRIVELTSAVFHCDRSSPWIAPAGPASNLAMGSLALLLGLWLRPRRPDVALFLLLVTSFSYFWESGYVIHAMRRRDGDLYFAGQDFLGEPSFGWRIAAGILGAVLATVPFTLRAGGADAWGDLRDAGLEIGACALPLLWVPRRGVFATSPEAATFIPRSVQTLAVALVVYSVFVATLGRGIGI
jgi:hypothetical protein